MPGYPQIPQPAASQLLTTPSVASQQVLGKGLSQRVLCAHSFRERTMNLTSELRF